MRIVEKEVKPTFTVASAFKSQRAKEGHSERLRAEVARLLSPGRASTAVVGEVFDLIVRRMSGTGRISGSDIERVLPGFKVEDNGGW